MPEQTATPVQAPDFTQVEELKNDIISKLGERRLSLKEFANEFNIVSYKEKVRITENGVPYLVFVNKDGLRLTISFTANMKDPEHRLFGKFVEDEVVGIKAFEDLVFGIFPNKDGEPRLKLASKEDGLVNLAFD